MTEQIRVVNVYEISKHKKTMKKIFVLASLALAFTFTACSDDESPGGGNNFTGTIWSGTTTTFTKTNGSDPADAANQDRITDNVILTRANDGGQIYNAASELQQIKTQVLQVPVGRLEELQMRKTLVFRLLEIP